MGAHIYYTDDIRTFILAAETIKQLVIVDDSATTRSPEYLNGWVAGFRQGLGAMNSTIKARRSAHRVWLRKDLKRILQTILHEAMQQDNPHHGAGSHPEGIRGFTQGFESSVWLVGMACGVTLFPNQPHPPSHRANWQPDKPWFLVEDIHRTITALGKVVDIIVRLSETQKDIERFLAGYTVGLQLIATTLKADISPATQQLSQRASIPTFWAKDDIVLTLRAGVAKSRPYSQMSANGFNPHDFQAGFRVALEIFSQATGIDLNLRNF